jgi:co-chaperonin GroES (HSP10)
MASLNVAPIKAEAIRAIKDHVLVADMNFSERFTSGGIFIPTDDMKSSGVRPRWAMVVAVGPEQQDVRVGQYILVTHGRWTRGLEIEMGGRAATIRRVDNNDILLVSDEPMVDDTMSKETDGGKMQADAKIYGSLHNS